MLNNKGLVVSSVLYTLLIAFLLFLGVTLAQFSSSAKIISNSTKDLVNNNELKGNMVYEVYPKEVFADYDKDTDWSNNYISYGPLGPVCGTSDHYLWYQKLKKNEYGQVISKIGEQADDSDTLVRIYSRYGTTFWPRDFEDKNNDAKSLTNKLRIVSCKKIDGSTHTCKKDDVINAINNGTKIFMMLEDTITTEQKEILIYKPC